MDKLDDVPPATEEEMIRRGYIPIIYTNEDGFRSVFYMYRDDSLAAGMCLIFGGRSHIINYVVYDMVPSGEMRGHTIYTKMIIRVHCKN